MPEVGGAVGSSVLGERLKNIRSRMAISAAELARQAGISYPTLFRIEKDQVDPSYKVVQQLASALSMTTSELLGELEPQILTDTDELRVAKQLAPIMAELKDVDVQGFIRNFAAMELPMQLSIERMVEQLASEAAMRRRPKNPLYRMMDEHLAEVDRATEVFIYRADRDDIDYAADKIDPILVEELVADGFTPEQLKGLSDGWSEAQNADQRAFLVRVYEDMVRSTNRLVGYMISNEVGDDGDWVQIHRIRSLDFSSPDLETIGGEEQAEWQRIYDSWLRTAQKAQNFIRGNPYFDPFTLLSFAVQRRQQSSRDFADDEQRTGQARQSNLWLAQSLALTLTHALDIEELRELYKNDLSSQELASSLRHDGFPENLIEPFIRAWMNTPLRQRQEAVRLLINPVEAAIGLPVSGSED